MVLISLVLVFAPGCESMTTMQTVPLKRSGSQQNMARVRVESVSMEAGAAREYAVGVRSGEYGFSDVDLANLKASLENSVYSAMESNELDSGKKVRILVLVRSYIVAYTSAAVAMLAAIDWCAVREDGSAIYSEIFYAPRSWYFLGPTPASEKNAITRAVVRRIGESALMLAAGGWHALPKATEGTYDAFEKAAATLPAKMRRAGFFYFIGPVPVPIAGSKPSSVPWHMANAPAAVSCDAIP